MAYQVLARKWRPRSFAELVGQEHVLRALVNTLDEDRLHHAYLFTGTRGVGKTTIARIIAKSLNCERGVSSTPCGECGACSEIDEGRFVDLIEVDAASRTRVDDTRELLDNVQYTPTRGRYKVYLIDEVHMLSTHSFNALLKTLEEPPPHVKFLLATTDPQKLPATVLSRCLQFNLKQMPPEQIVAHHEQILKAEGVEYEPQALKHIARAAEGSMRDSLSLLDQAIAYGHGAVRSEEVVAMLGFISRDHIQKLLTAVASGDSAGMMAALDQLAEMAPDFVTVFDELIGTLHQLAIAKRLPEAADDSLMDREQLLALADHFSEEDIQLYYQMALMGKRDLPLLSEPRQGLEMALLRMLAFCPSQWGEGGEPAKKPTAAPPVESVAPQHQPSSCDTASTVSEAWEAAPEASEAGQAADAEITAPAVAQSGEWEQEPTAVHRNSTTDDVSTSVPSLAPGCIEEIDWNGLVEELALDSLSVQVAKNASLREWDGQRLTLALDASLESLSSPATTEALERALTERWQQTVRINLQLQREVTDTPAQLDREKHDAAHQALLDSIENDPFIKDLKRTFQASVKMDSIKLIDAKVEQT
ncbi:MAG: DNA polymerase III subunit gamma/tau [Pseudomonadota bacterium]